MLEGTAEMPTSTKQIRTIEIPEQINPRSVRRSSIMEKSKTNLNEKESKQKNINSLDWYSPISFPLFNQTNKTRQIKFNIENEHSYNQNATILFNVDTIQPKALINGALSFNDFKYLILHNTESLSLRAPTKPLPCFFLVFCLISRTVVMWKVAGIPLIVKDVTSVRYDDVTAEWRPEVLIAIKSLTLFLYVQLLSPVKM